MIQVASAVAVVIVIVILYAIHVRQKRLEERGFVEPTRESGGIPFAALQQFVEPSAAHIQQVREEQQHHAQKEAPGDAGTRQ